MVLSAAPLLSLTDLHALADGACLEGDFLKLLQKGVSELKGREEPQGHTVLILDKVVCYTDSPIVIFACLVEQ